MAYALVQDLPLSWEQYERLARLGGDDAPTGLILHLAGPTDEGVRVIDVWDSERSSRIAGRTAVRGGAPTLGAATAEPTVRDLHGIQLVLGPAAALGQPTPAADRSTV